MRTPIRRALTGTALACAAGAMAFATTTPASALSWYSVNEHSVTTWHCTAELVGHVAQTGEGSRVTTYYDASETITSGQYYQVGDGPQCDGYFQTSTNGGRTWQWTDDSAGFTGRYKTASTAWYNDNSPVIARACLQEFYWGWTQGVGWRYYQSGLRCTAAW